jgi:hypothetical protein
MKSLKIGDKIRVKNTFNNYMVEVIRITKTMAIAKTPFNNEQRFRLNYHETFGPDPLPRQKWQTTDYTVIENN